MDWKTAFAVQARSDNEIRKILNKNGVPYCHQLHYLQMAAEKLAKSMLCRAGSSTPPSFTHKGFVTVLRTLESDPGVVRFLGFGGKKPAFKTLIRSLVPLANAIEQLAPNLAGQFGPNPEYPWESGTQIEAPCQYAFSGFDPRNVAMTKLIWILDRLLDYVQ